MSRVLAPTWMDGQTVLPWRLPAETLADHGRHGKETARCFTRTGVQHRCFTLEPTTDTRTPASQINNNLLNRKSSHNGTNQDVRSPKSNFEAPPHRLKYRQGDRIKQRKIPPLFRHLASGPGVSFKVIAVSKRHKSKVMA